MITKDFIRIFLDEIFSKHPKKKYPTNKFLYNHLHEIWTIDLADMVDYEISNNKKFSYKVVITDDFIKYTWAIPIKNKNNQKIATEFSNILTTSKRKPLKIESDRGAEWYISIFHYF